MSSAFFVLGYVLIEDHNFYHVNGVTRDYLKENKLDSCRVRTILNPGAYSKSQGISMYRTIKRVEQKKELEPVNYQTTLSSGPQTPVYCQIGCMNAGSVAGVPPNVTTYVNVTVTYYCKLFDRVNLDA